MSRPKTVPQQQLWNDLARDNRAPTATVDLDKWAAFIDGVTDYDGVSVATWNGTEVYLDAASPYVLVPDARFPVEQPGVGGPVYHAWASPSQGVAHVKVAPPTPSSGPGSGTSAGRAVAELDEAVHNTTAFPSFADLVAAMRGRDGYGQKYTPTLRPECHPDFEDALHAVREEVQRLGFRVFPDDSFYAPKSPDAPAHEAPDESIPTLDNLVVDASTNAPDDQPDPLSAEPDAWELEL